MVSCTDENTFSEVILRTRAQGYRPGGEEPVGVHVGPETMFLGQDSPVFSGEGDEVDFTPLTAEQAASILERADVELETAGKKFALIFAVIIIL